MHCYLTNLESNFLFYSSSLYFNWQKRGAHYRENKVELWNLLKIMLLIAPPLPPPSIGYHSMLLPCLRRSIQRKPYNTQSSSNTKSQYEQTKKRGICSAFKTSWLGSRRPSDLPTSWSPIKSQSDKSLGWSGWR